MSQSVHEGTRYGLRVDDAGTNSGIGWRQGDAVAPGAFIVGVWLDHDDDSDTAQVIAVDPEIDYSYREHLR